MLRPEKELCKLDVYVNFAELGEMEEKIQLGWKVPVPIKDGFQKYCDKVGSNYADGLAAAMVIWQKLPASVQRLAQLEASGEPGVDQQFWKEFEAGLDDAILDRIRKLKDR